MKKGTWIVLGLVLILGFLYFLSKENQISVGVKHLSLPTFSPDKVDRIEILDKENVTLVKQGNEWDLEIGDKDHRRRVKADQENVKSMLDAALGLRDSHYVTNLKEKYQDLGLAGETTTIKIFTGPTRVFAIVLGKNAGSSGRYAKLPDSDEVHVIRGSFWQLTRNGLIDWRERQIVRVNEGDLLTFKIMRASAPLSLVKEGESWTFDKSEVLPAGFRVDKNALAGLVRSAANLRASGFIDEKRDIKNPLITLHFGTKDKTYDVEIFSDGTDRILAKRVSDDQIYEIAKSSFERINRPISDFRDLSVLNFDKNSVVQISLAFGKDHVIARKKDNAWQLEQPKTLPKDFEFDTNSVDDVVSLLSGLTALRGALPKDVPQTPNWEKSWLVELLTDKGEKIHLYASKNKANSNEYLVRGNMDKEIYVVKAARISSLTTGINAFKKEKFDLPPIDKNTNGFESLPVDIQRKLLNATQKK